MTPKWLLLVVIYLVIDISDVGAKKTSSSSSSRGSSSRSSSSRGSYTGSHGSYGWTATRRPVYTTHRYQMTTHRPFTERTHPTRPHYVTTMPTHRTTKRVYYTTMPTQRSTTRKVYYTTMPTHRTTRTTTRQPAYNPFYSTTKSYVQPTLGRRNNSLLNQATSRQPPFNPFFSTTKQPHHNPFFTTKSSQLGRQNNSILQSATTKQPPYNPFFTTKSSQLGRQNVSHLQSATSKQPPYNPFFSTPQPSPGRHNGSMSQQTPNWHVTSKPTAGYVNHSRPGSNGNGMTPRPGLIHTTKVVPNNSGLSNGRYNNSRPSTSNWRPTPSWSATTSRPTFIGPSWNHSSTHGNAGTNGAIYRPPGNHNNPIPSRPNYITGTHPSYNPHTTYPTSPGHTVINNNYHYHPGGGYYQPSTGSSSVPHVTVINNNNYHNPNHHVIVPSRHYYGYGPPAVGITVVNPDYYSYHVSPSYVTTYRYSSVDTGSTALGFYLGYQLGRISRPSYYYHSTSYVNNEYIPRYDHYTVHHYYHNSQSIPKESPIQPNAIVVCPGDSGAICPQGNMPLCTNNGAVMCVVSAQNTVPCSSNVQSNCVRSTIACTGNNSPECKDESTASISIPCVSTAKINAGVEYINNSIVVANANDVSTKSFCVTIVAIPDKSSNATKNSTEIPKNFTLPFHYTTNDTGVGLLGYYLGYKLENLLEPSWSYLNFDDSYNYIEKFDHYNVFHYDHDSNVLPKDVDIQSNQIMKCAGDSGTFCPQNSSSMCLTDGAVMCTAEFSSAVYNPEFQNSYILSNISCNNLKSPACISTPNDTISMQIPCISTAKVYAKTSYMIQSYGVGSNLKYYKTLEPVLNGTAVEYSSTPRELCVIVLALPGEKIVAEASKKRKVTGIPNASKSLSLPKYNYTINDTGNTVLGYQLARRFGQLAYPTFYYVNALLYATNGDVQKYDHYSVHYYEHGREILPSDLALQASDIRGCAGDSGVICPGNTTSVCLNDGAVWCVTDQLLTERCEGYNDTMCVTTELTCRNNDSPLCKNVNSKVVSLPCVSTLTVTGNIMAVNNSIYKINAKKPKPYFDLQMIPGGDNITSRAQHFCVTIVSIPVERNITVGEKIFDKTNSVFGNIMAKIFA